MFDENKKIDPAIFAELKKLAIKRWASYDNTFGYASEKIDRIIFLGNTQDNFCYIFRMFDIFNQEIIYEQSSDSLKELLKIHTGYGKKFYENWL